MARKSDNHLLVAALDFGTTYSGYAFSTRQEFKTDPLKIHTTAVWKSGTQAMMATMKTPTCLLLNNEQGFVAFGYEAENTYADLVMEGKQEDHLYFNRFKMYPHNNKNITHDMVLEDVTGKTLSALEVFTFSIKALVDHVIKTIQKQVSDLRLDDIRWVLTVPAIWSDNAKQFMRTSAEKAGISPDKLFLALEPETASIFCQYLAVEKLKGGEPGFTMTAVGTRYMVVDIGGGTADITVHEKAPNGQLKELYRATGNACGGTSVDRSFFKMLKEIFGENVLTTLKKTHPLGYLDLEREFEAKKRNIELNPKQAKVTLKIPISSLEKICKQFHGKSVQSVIDCSAYSREITIYEDKIRINYDIVRGLFKPSIEEVISLMKEILNDRSTQGVLKLLMVGGFSECQLLEEAISQNFPKKEIIIPEDASMSVLKGAVLFGHRPDYIQSRVMRCSYGIKTNVPFDERKHDAKHRVNMDGEDRCDNIFSLIVEKDQQVEEGTVIKRSYFTPYRNQEVMEFMVYTSTNRFPFYIDDESCTLLCKPTITFPNTCEEKRWVDVEYTFGNTEIGLKAVDRNSGNEIMANLHLI